MRSKERLAAAWSSSPPAAAALTGLGAKLELDATPRARDGAVCASGRRSGPTDDDEPASGGRAPTEVLKGRAAPMEDALERVRSFCDSIRTRAGDAAGSAAVVVRREEATDRNKCGCSLAHGRSGSRV